MRFKKKKAFSPIVFFRDHHLFSTCISVVLSVAIINLTFGCTYYKVQEIVTTYETLGKEIDNFNKMGRYAIVHVGEHSWHLDNLMVNEDRRILSGTVKKTSPEHTYKKDRKRSGNRYNKQKPMDEIHFDLIPGTPVPELGQNVEIPFSRINSISLNKGDGGTSVAVFLLGTLGALVGVFLIILATKSSCPFVYVKNGQTFDFAGELYPGVITANMQRDDFLQLLPKNFESEEFVIKITNELKEVQHTDFVQLLVTENIEGAEILLDSDGNPHSFISPQKPLRIIEDGSAVDMEPAMNKDNVVYYFNSSDDDFKNTRELILEFGKTSYVEAGKLYLTTKNSLWLDYIFGRFNALFGTYYNTFQADQQNSSMENSMDWMNAQQIPLSVYIDTNNGWKLVERINPVGPLSFRNIVVPVDLADTPDEVVRIKLETGFMFWEMDYAAFDLTENLPVHMHYVKPDKAIDENGKTVTKLLSSQDQVYLTQPSIGNSVEVTFDLTNLPFDEIGSIYLQNRGYYNYIRNYTSEPDFRKLRVFREDESFTQFSRLEYYNMMDFADKDDIALKDD